MITFMKNFIVHEGFQIHLKKNRFIQCEFEKRAEIFFTMYIAFSNRKAHNFFFSFFVIRTILF